MKPIKITNFDVIEKNLREMIETKLKNFKETDKEFKFSASMKELMMGQLSEVQRPLIRMSPLTYMMMMELVYTCPDEIAWHGTVQRLGDAEFYLDNVMVFPQKVTGTTVNSDDDKYPLWLMELDNEVINHLHWHGHSHVNMGVTPSGVDDHTWDNFLSIQPEDGFYIFCIANKRRDINWYIYDFKTNIIYEPTDIDFEVDIDDASCIKDWAKDAIEEYVTKRTITVSTYDPKKYPGIAASTTNSTTAPAGSKEDPEPFNWMANYGQTSFEGYKGGYPYYGTGY